MSLDHTARRNLEKTAAGLRALARKAKGNPILAAAHMGTHGLIMDKLTADRDPIGIGDEIVFLYPGEAEGAPLVRIDGHYDVIQTRDGMVGVTHTMWRGRTAEARPQHWAPLTAVKRTSDGHRCPEGAGRAVQEAGAR